MQTRLARQVAEQLMAKDALTAHASRRIRHRGNHHSASRPGCGYLGCNIFAGRCHAVADGFVSLGNALVPTVSATSLAFRAILGAIGAKTGGANIQRSTIRDFLGAFALALIAGIGKLFGTVV